MEMGNFLELQLWQRTSGNDYIRRSFSIIDNVNTTSNNNVYKYSPNPPLEVQEGDVLGVFQPSKGESPFTIFFQENSGPFNYGEQSGVNEAFPSLTTDDPLDQNDYPLVSVILGEFKYKTLE